jgi:hypothetical protein
MAMPWEPAIRIWRRGMAADTNLDLMILVDFFLFCKSCFSFLRLLTSFN